MKYAYLDCFAGIAGDMTVAAMLDLGLDEMVLARELGKLDLEGYSLEVRRSTRRGIAGVRFEVHIDAGNNRSRKYSLIRDMIACSGLGEAPKELALKMFAILARAEAKVHGIPVDDVHFHEVGAIDSIVDLVSVAVGIHELGLERVLCSPIPLARGFVKTAHGMLPTPAPATLEILNGVPVKGIDSSIELVTPTGAAIVKALASEFGDYPQFVPEKTGYGLGRSDPEQFPNALRVVMGRPLSALPRPEVVGEIQFQVDDLDPRILGDLMESLLEEGALDVTFTPVQMKKNRPGTLVTVLCPPDRVHRFAELLLTATSTIGLRVGRVERIVLLRSIETVSTSLGPVRVKVVTRPDGRKDRLVEFDDARRIARLQGQPVLLVLQALQSQVNFDGRPE